MKRYALLLLALPLLVAAGASAPQFKNPAVRDAVRRYEGAKNGLRIALDRAVNQAVREGDQTEVERLRAQLDALDVDGGTVVIGIQGRVERALTGTRWKRADGTWFELQPEGSIATAHGPTSGVWRVRSDGSVLVAWGQAVARDVRVYQFAADGTQAMENRISSGDQTQWQRTH